MGEREVGSRPKTFTFIRPYVKELTAYGPFNGATMTPLETQLEIIRRHEAGERKVDIAKDLGLSRPTVDKYIREGATPPAPHPALELLAEGLSKMEVAERLGLTRQRIYQVEAENDTTSPVG